MEWAYRNGVRLKLVEPGKPAQNAYLESFNGRFRDECLNEHWFTGLAEARILIAARRRDGKENRPHSALGHQMPAEFSARFRSDESGGNETRETVEDDSSLGGMRTLVIFRIPTAIDLARSKGAPTIALTSGPSREAAHRLYRTLGFDPRETTVYRITL